MLLVRRPLLTLLLLSLVGTANPQQPPPTRDDLLRGAYGPYRANNDLLHYDLHLRVDPSTETIRGSNTIRFRMLADATRIQIELAPDLALDAVTLATLPLQVTREERTLWIDFPETLRSGQTYEVTLAYHGQPRHEGRFGCFSFDKTPTGQPWITTSCEDEGASLWWPNKDQWRDEPDQGVDLAIAVPNGLTDVSNGRLLGSRDLGDGFTEWHWQVTYPINNYDVALNIAPYQHFTLPPVGPTTLDFYVLPADVDKARSQFTQVPGMFHAFERFIGPYPFPRDGYKLVEVPYAGMEHQSAVAYGNHFVNSYYPNPDWTGAGISPRFDFILVHESAHEWFGNAVSAADRSDMWIQEGWTTYLECLYVEDRWGRADGVRYCSSLRSQVRDEGPILQARGINANPPRNQYFRGALMLHTLRSWLGDDVFLPALRDFFAHFEYQNIMTEDVVAWWSQRSGIDLNPFFDQYLRHAALPILQLRFDPADHTVQYRWQADEPAFAMSVEVGDPAHWTRITPRTTAWQTLPWPGSPTSFALRGDHYYIEVSRDGAPSKVATVPGEVPTK